MRCVCAQRTHAESRTVKIWLCEKMGQRHRSSSHCSGEGSISCDPMHTYPGVSGAEFSATDCLESRHRLKSHCLEHLNKSQMCDLMFFLLMMYWFFIIIFLSMK